MKAVKTLSKMTNLLIDTVFTAVLLLGCYFAYDSWYVYHHADLSQVRVRAAENPGADLPREWVFGIFSTSSMRSPTISSV